MNQDDKIDLSSLPRETTPPRGLEERVVESLSRQGLLGAKARVPGLRWRTPATVAVALALAFLGFLLGRSVRVADPVELRATHALLLFEGPQYQQPQGEAELVQRITEYTAWRRDMERSGVLVGFKLADERTTVGADGSAAEEPVLAGLFLLNVPSDAAATELAKSCPHTKYDGRVEVRAIEGGRR